METMPSLTSQDLAAEGGELLPDKEVLSILDLFVNLDLALDLTAPVDLAVAANANIAAPMVVITGDVDKTVSTNIHSRPLAAVVPNARLIVLPGVGHMVQNAAPDLVVSEIEAMIGTIARSAAAQSATPRF